MRRISTSFEVILSAALLVLGLYMLQAGISRDSTSASALLIGGAVFITVGMMTLLSAVRSILWHRRMVRHSLNHALDSAAHGDNRG